MVNVFTNKSFLTIPLDDLPDEILARVMSNRLRNMAVSRRFASILPKPEVQAVINEPHDVTELTHALGLGLVDVVHILVIREDCDWEKENRDDEITLHMLENRDGALLGKLRMCLPQCRHTLRVFSIANLDRFDCDQIWVGEEGAALLATALQRCTLIEELLLPNCGLDYHEGNGIPFLATAIANMTALRKLDLEYNFISPLGMKSLVKGLWHCKKLEYLNLRDDEIQDEGVRWLATLLPELLSLRYLDLAKNEISSEGLAQLAVVLPRCPSLKNLRLNYLRLDMSGGGIQPLAAVLPLCPMLTFLSLGFSTLHHQSIMALAAAIPQCVNLESLNIVKCGIHQDSVEALADAFWCAPHLEYVNMKENEFSDPTLLFELNQTRVPTIEIEWESDSEDNESDNDSDGHSDSEYSDSDDDG